MSTAIKEIQSAVSIRMPIPVNVYMLKIGNATEADVPRPPPAPVGKGATHGLKAEQSASEHGE